MYISNKDAEERGLDWDGTTMLLNKERFRVIESTPTGYIIKPEEKPYDKDEYMKKFISDYKR